MTTGGGPTGDGVVTITYTAGGGAGQTGPTTTTTSTTVAATPASSVSPVATAQPVTPTFTG